MTRRVTVGDVRIRRPASPATIHSQYGVQPARPPYTVTVNNYGPRPVWVDVKTDTGWIRVYPDGQVVR